MEGDVVAWTPCTIDEVEIGDIVVFKSYVHWPGEKLVIHRVNEIITDSKGLPILETKGDANKWTDQSGPHIPEPYIREDHLMGKAVSVGSIPLKIPVIGYLGILVNDGLQQLSAASSSKGSLTFLAVFTPLTISSIVFIGLLFLLPEKAKTLKEKIKFYILGPHPIEVKKIFITFVLTYFLFFSFIHIFAYDSSNGSVGIEASSPDSALNFGQIRRGKESFELSLPVLNPGIMPLKGIIYGKDDFGKYLSPKTFELYPGGSEKVLLKTIADENAEPGSYKGEIMVYSSPFWTVIPDQIITKTCEWNRDFVVNILDFLAASMLTTITIFVLVAITIISNKYTIISIDLCWKHPYKILIKPNTMNKIRSYKKTTKKIFTKKIGWISKINIIECEDKKTLYESIKKPLISSIIILPIIFLIDDNISALILSAIIAGLLTYFMKCRFRKKIILSSIIAMSFSITYSIFQTQFSILARQSNIMNIITLLSGTIGVYLIVIGLLLVPICLITWYIVNILRNVKEQKEPLLILEGECDL